MLYINIYFANLARAVTMYHTQLDCLIEKVQACMIAEDVVMTHNLLKL